MTHDSEAKVSLAVEDSLYLGIDFGTSGCRAIVINDQQKIIADANQLLPSPEHLCGRIQQSAALWLESLHSLFQQLAEKLDLQQISRLAIDGTSGSVLICNDQGKALLPALMYNDASSFEALQTIKQHCPSAQHITMSVSSGLAKAIQLCDDFSLDANLKILNQADFLTNSLCGMWGFSDYHNALKLGYDVEKLLWPEWIVDILPQHSLPEVLQPGDVIGTIAETFCEKYGFSKTCEVCAGTTDANAAFIATQSIHAGDAVTSLGSTLVLKILNTHFIQDLQSGVYSHKLGDLWLTGGASNAGGAILRECFTDEEIQQQSAEINLNQPTGLDYYPLTTTGERFPDPDPNKKPVLTPRPDSDVTFLQAILEGLSKIEQTGYQKLFQLGTVKPTQIQTCGGGAKNPQWGKMRSMLLDLPVKPATHTDACFGSALLAFQGLTPYIKR